ncbi:JmjC domain-containing protein 7 [Madurella mycetomatis]|uniref:JmjC domain-containing protein 7 n=1 Tax=Madurella mycetomatis TaxID=100816 RepID=A0A175W5X3_9PEZI|nr:JmjC domain-containing protein 7 [Madurella mycetomatis]
MDQLQFQDPIAELITNYNELNSSVIEELDEEPSPLEFLRFVARNTPFVVRGAAADWQATRTWNVEFLKDVLRDEPVNVAVTPAGNADSPTPLTKPGFDNINDGTTTNLVFAKPHEEDQPFATFLDYLITQEQKTASLSSQPAKEAEEEGESQGEVRYAQTQNDNLRHEYRPLFAHVQRTVPFARIALARDPDAINLWIGNSRSVTALHKDNYENIYVQIAGQKHFVLFPPVCQPCVNEKLLTTAHYERRSARDDGGGRGGLELAVEEDAVAVPFAIWDPDRPGKNETRYSKLAEPMRVTLNAGDMLYLPCMWYHKVSQSCSPEGVCIAVNYWYDMDFSGPLYPLSTFVRSVSNTVGE